jgi:excisionase family DNA binding protein
MSTVINEEYATLEEAARILQVHKATIRRWIDAGLLPSYRMGRRRLLIKRGDLANMITPARPARPNTGPVGTTDQVVIPKLTPEQQRQMLAALETARRHSAELLKYRAGQPVPESWELLNEARDERTRQLTERS